MVRKHLLVIEQEEKDSKSDFLKEIEMFENNGYEIIDIGCIDKELQLSEVKLSKNMNFNKINKETLNDCISGDCQCKNN